MQGALQLVAGRLNKAPKDLKIWLEHEDSAYGTSIMKEQERLFKEAGVASIGIGAHSARPST